MTNPFSLEGKNAWITGASYGIGFNIAKAFVAAGIKTIIFNDINEEFLQRGLNNYKEAGITNVKGYVCDVTKERTNNLLNQSKIQAEELASKEEEMRQNMEELQATQEEAARRENESNAIMEVINSKLIVVDYDMDGTITNVNDTYASMLGVANNEIIGQKSDEGVDMTPEQMQNHIKMWSNLRNGQTVTETNHIILNGKARIEDVEYADEVEIVDGSAVEVQTESENK